MTCMSLPTPTLHNARLRLRPFTDADADALFALHSSAHVLRYWDQEFPQLKPEKRRGNRRYYQRQDVLIIRQIRSLLYEEGFTIGGARQRLTGDEARSDTSQSQQIIRQVRAELEDVLKLLRR